MKHIADQLRAGNQATDFLPFTLAVRAGAFE
jgi:hypothetical protein